MQHFKSSQVGQSANKKQKVASKVLTALWAQFILVLSFFADGANAILKVDGMIHYLFTDKLSCLATIYLKLKILPAI